MLVEGRRARRLRRLPDSRAAPLPPPRGPGAAVCVGAGVTCQPKAAAPCCVVMAVSALPAEPPAGDAHGACMPKKKPLRRDRPRAGCPGTADSACSRCRPCCFPTCRNWTVRQKCAAWWGGSPSSALLGALHCCVEQSMRGGELTGEGFGRRVPVLRAARRPASGGLCAACRGAGGECSQCYAVQTRLSEHHDFGGGSLHPWLLVPPHQYPLQKGLIATAQSQDLMKMQISFALSSWSYEAYF